MRIPYASSMCNVAAHLADWYVPNALSLRAETRAECGRLPTMCACRVVMQRPPNHMLACVRVASDWRADRTFWPARRCVLLCLSRLRRRWLLRPPDASMCMPGSISASLPPPRLDRQGYLAALLNFAADHTCRLIDAGVFLHPRAGLPLVRAPACMGQRVPVQVCSSDGRMCVQPGRGHADTAAKLPTDLGASATICFWRSVRPTLRSSSAHSRHLRPAAACCDCVLLQSPSKGLWDGYLNIPTRAGNSLRSGGKCSHHVFTL
jgi:hypothetical protein